MSDGRHGFDFIHKHNIIPLLLFLVILKTSDLKNVSISAFISHCDL